MLKEVMLFCVLILTVTFSFAENHEHDTLFTDSSNEVTLESDPSEYIRQNEVDASEITPEIVNEHSDILNQLHELNNPHELDTDILTPNLQEVPTEYFTDGTLSPQQNQEIIAKCGVNPAPECAGNVINPQDFNPEDLNAALNANGFEGLSDVILNDYPDAILSGGNLVTPNADGSTNTIPLTDLQSQLNQGSQIEINPEGETTITIDGTLPPPQPEPAETESSDTQEQSQTQTSPDQTTSQNPEQPQATQPTPFQPQPNQNFNVQVSNNQQFQTQSQNNLITTTDGIIQINNQNIILKEGTHKIDETIYQVHGGEVEVTNDITIAPFTEVSIITDERRTEISTPVKITLGENITISGNTTSATLQEGTIVQYKKEDDKLVPEYYIKVLNEDPNKKSIFTITNGVLHIQQNNGIQAGILYWAANGQVKRLKPINANQLAVQLTPVKITNDETKYSTERNQSRIHFYTIQPQSRVELQNLFDSSGVTITRIKNALTNLFDEDVEEFPKKAFTTTSLLKNLGLLTPAQAKRYAPSIIVNESIKSHELDAFLATHSLIHENITIIDRRPTIANSIFTIDIFEKFTPKIQNWSTQDGAFINPVTQDLWLPHSNRWEVLILEERESAPLKKRLSHTQALDYLEFTRVTTSTDLSGISQQALEILITQSFPITITRVEQFPNKEKISVVAQRPSGKAGFTDYYHKAGIINGGLWVYEEQWVVYIPH